MFEGYIKKPTTLLTNLPELKILARRCNHTHMHRPCLGKVWSGGKWASVARAAGAYPPLLCDVWAKAVAHALATANLA